jgi:hypothetical protein
MNKKEVNLLLVLCQPQGQLEAFLELSELGKRTTNRIRSLYERGILVPSLLSFSMLQRMADYDTKNMSHHLKGISFVEKLEKGYSLKKDAHTFSSLFRVFLESNSLNEFKETEFYNRAYSCVLGGSTERGQDFLQFKTGERLLDYNDSLLLRYLLIGGMKQQKLLREIMSKHKLDEYKVFLGLEHAFYVYEVFSGMQEPSEEYLEKCLVEISK